MSVVLDASALLVFAQAEHGADVVEAALLSGAACAATNWSEVAQKVLAAGRDWDLVRALIASYDVDIQPVTAADGEWAARRWRPNEGLSLADRLCMAVAERLDVDVLTANAVWGTEGRIHQIR